MQVIIEKNYSKLSKKAAEIIAGAIREKPNIVLGLATGSTPVGTYKELIRMNHEEGLDFSNVITFNLDEYYGLSPEDTQSYHYYMNDIFFKHINIKQENIHIPNGQAKDTKKYGKEYDKEIEKIGGIDLQLLGIGQNGHIAFNEPEDELEVITHLTGLTDDTIEANSRFFETIDEVPTKAITMGLGSIMKSKRILLLANGEKKAKVMNELLKGEKISTKIPASVILLHNNATIIVDEEAASIYKNEIENK